MIQNINTGDAIQGIYQRYLKVCREAVKSEKVFKTFKSHPDFMEVLEHCSARIGQNHLDQIINNYPSALLHEKVIDNDSIGEPLRIPYAVPKEIMFRGILISPTTLQYINVVSNLRMKLGTLDGLAITEIGGGYGGQCKVIQDYFNIDRYDIVDLPEVAELQFKYLSRLNQIEKVNIFKCDSDYLPVLRSKYDLVISNYALSEMPRDVQLNYVKHVCLKSTHGYLTCNDRIEGMELIEKKFSVTMENDIKGERETNFIITW